MVVPGLAFATLNLVAIASSTHEDLDAYALLQHKLTKASNPAGGPNQQQAPNGLGAGPGARPEEDDGHLTKKKRAEVKSRIVEMCTEESRDSIRDWCPEARRLCLNAFDDIQSCLSESEGKDTCFKSICYSNESNEGMNSPLGQMCQGWVQNTVEWCRPFDPERSELSASERATEIAEQSFMCRGVKQFVCDIWPPAFIEAATHGACQTTEQREQYCANFADEWKTFFSAEECGYVPVPPDDSCETALDGVCDERHGCGMPPERLFPGATGTDCTDCGNCEPTAAGVPTPGENPTSIECGGTYPFTISNAFQAWKPKLHVPIGQKVTLSTCDGGSLDTMIWTPFCENDDACGLAGTQSKCSFHSSAGKDEVHNVKISAYGDNTGSSSLKVTCTQQPPELPELHPRPLELLDAAARKPDNASALQRRAAPAQPALLASRASNEVVDEHLESSVLAKCAEPC